jgi:hypothetical protein
MDEAVVSIRSSSLNKAVPKQVHGKKHLTT